jgi:hypothetical protein
VTSHGLFKMSCPDRACGQHQGVCREPGHLQVGQTVRRGMGAGGAMTAMALVLTRLSVPGLLGGAECQRDCLVKSEPTSGRVVAVEIVAAENGAKVFAIMLSQPFLDDRQFLEPV